MAAGDVQYIGWTTSPQTYEYAARLNYIPVYTSTESDQVIKRLTRTILCHDTVKQAVVQQLKAVSAISAPVVQTDGSLSSESFGGGYRVHSINDSKHGTGFSLLSVVYEKTVSTLFEFNLPTGVTITNADGISAILYNGTKLVEYDSGKGVTTSGLQIVQDMEPQAAIRHLFEAQNINYPDRIPAVPFTFVVDGVRMHTVEVVAADMIDSVTQLNYERVETERVIWRSKTYEETASLGEDFEPEEQTTIAPLDPVAPQPDTRLPASALSVDGYSDKPISGAEKDQYEDLGEGLQSSVRQKIKTEQKKLLNLDTGIEYTYPVVQIVQEVVVSNYKTIPSRDYGFAQPTGPASNAYFYTGRTLFPEWELLGDSLRIHVHGATLMQWDVGGL